MNPRSRTSTKRSHFISLERFVEQSPVRSWPVSQWIEAWRTVLFEWLGPVYDRAGRMLEQAGHGWNSTRGQELRRRLILKSQQREAFGSPWDRYLPGEEKKAFLFVGEAGIGKSHLFAKAAEQAVRNDAPVLLLLGQDFLDADPRTTILNRFDFRGRSFEAFLGALDAAALATDSRAIILIDAVNEGKGLSVWPRELGRLLEELRRWPRIVLGISCRAEYLAATIPASVQGQLFRIELRGFQSSEEREQAAKVYLDRRGIVRPASPSLDPEFSNPLFLRIACEALLRSGQRIFPRGLRGAKRVFHFVFETRGRFLGTARDGTDDLVRPLIKALSSLARAMASARQDFLAIDEASQIVDGAFRPYPAPEGKTWSDVLRGNGFLRKDLLPGPDGTGFAPPEEVLRFTFQRLADQLMAEALIDQVSSIDAAFRCDGPLAFIIEDSFNKRRNNREITLLPNWAGLCGALWIAIAERFGREMVDLPGLGDQEDVFLVGFSEPFRESLRWREPSAFTPRTRDVLRWLFPRLEGDRLPIYLEFALVPKHPWNIDNLGPILIAHSLPKRDAWWSSALADTYSDAHRIALRILDWAQNSDSQRADDETLHLTLLTVAWFLTVTNRGLRDRATKVIAALFFAHPERIAPLLTAMGSVNDDYLRERVFAAAYGALLHLRSHSLTTAACAEVAYRIIFEPQNTCWHMTLRDYARGIIEVAAFRSVLPRDIPIPRCRPPYNSPMITDWPRPLDVKRLAEERKASSILSSTLGWINEDGKPGLAGDFGRYRMGFVSSAFSAEPRSDAGPDCPANRKAAFWSRVRELGPKAAPAVDELLDLDLRRIKRRESFLPRIETKEDPLEITIIPWDADDSELMELESRIAALRARLRSELSPELLEEWDQAAVLSKFGDEKPDRFDLSKAQAWVAWRALDLGWSAELHEKKERQFSRYSGRTDHQVERIGKKYQWIAFNELCGYLIDHHWYFSDWGNVALPFDRVDAFDRRDIDPSFWRTEKMDFAPNPETPSVSAYSTDFRSDDVQDAIAWTKTLADLPEPDRLIETRNGQGDEWWMTTWWYRDKDYMAKQQSTGAMRTAQASINMIILHEADIPRFVETAIGRNFGNDRLLGAGETAHVFVGEHAWDTGCIDSISEITLDEDYHGVPYSIPTVRLQTKRGEYDHSDTLDHAIFAPNSQLIARMKLRIEGPTGEGFVTESARTAFMDLSFSSRLPEIGVVSAKKLQRALADEKLRPLWVFWAEKDGGRGRGEHFAHDHSDVSRTVFGGCYWRADDGWKSSGIWRVNSDD
jgi:hypothetical protein